MSRVGVEVRHLPEGVHAGVGAAGAAHDVGCSPVMLAERVLDRRLHGRAVGLALPAGEVGAVVLDDHAEAPRHEKNISRGSRPM